MFACIACVLTLMRFLSPLKRSCFINCSNSTHPHSFYFVLGSGEKIPAITENFWMLTSINVLLEA